MITGKEILKVLNINRDQLDYLVFYDVLIPVIKRNTILSDLFDEKDVELFLSDKEIFKNNLLALQIEKEWQYDK